MLLLLRWQSPCSVTQFDLMMSPVLVDKTINHPGELWSSHHLPILLGIFTHDEAMINPRLAHWVPLFIIPMTPPWPGHAIVMAPGSRAAWEVGAWSRPQATQPAMLGSEGVSHIGTVSIVHLYLIYIYMEYISNISYISYTYMIYKNKCIYHEYHIFIFIYIYT